LPDVRTNPAGDAVRRRVDADHDLCDLRVQRPHQGVGVSFERLVPGDRADQTTVRRANLGVVMRHVAVNAPCSRARIAAETGLTRGTVSSLVAELVELDLLRAGGGNGQERRPGRPAQPLELADTAVAVGLEVNVDSLEVSVEDLTGRVRYERRVFADNRRAASGPVLDRIARMAADAIGEMEGDGLRVVGIAVAVPGLVATASGTVLRAPNLGWTRVPIADELHARLPDVDLPIHVENEANLSALAEHWQGAARGVRSFISVFGEVGVGAGIVVDGELYRGLHGFGGEFGHITVDPDGEPCACGSRGCLETLVGQEAIARRAGLSIDSGKRTWSITAALVRRARAGDPAVLGALNDAGRWLGVGLASAVNLLDLDVVVLGGCFGPLSPWLSTEVEKALRNRVLSADWSACELRSSAIGELAAVRGAAALTLRELLAAPWTVARGERVGVAVR
jgi:predicted NBD/HSP70 family sugar kinase